jgi:hypothetical protein
MTQHDRGLGEGPFDQNDRAADPSQASVETHTSTPHALSAEELASNLTNTLTALAAGKKTKLVLPPGMTPSNAAAMIVSHSQKKVSVECGVGHQSHHHHK